MLRHGILKINSLFDKHVLNLGYEYFIFQHGILQIGTIF